MLLSVSQRALKDQETIALRIFMVGQLYIVFLINSLLKSATRYSFFEFV